MKIWQVMWRLFCFTPWLYTLSLILQVISFAIQLVPGLLIQKLFDTLAKKSQPTFAYEEIVALLVAVAVVHIVFFLSTAVLEANCFIISTTLLRKNLFQAILDRPGAQSLPFPPGDIVSRLRDDITFIGEYIRFSVFSVGNITLTITAIIILIRINFLITLLILVPLITASIFINIISPRVQKYHQKSRATSGDVSAFLGGIFNSVQSIQITNSESEVINYFRQLNSLRQQAALKERLFNDVVIQSFMKNMSQLSVGIILLLIVQSIRKGNFTVGDLALFAYFLPWIADFTSILSQNMAQYKQTTVAMQRLLSLIDDFSAEALIKYGPTYLQGPLPTNFSPQKDAPRLFKLECKDLTYSYPHSQSGIKNINLCLNHGTLTIITGRTGSGKTTLLRVLLGLLPKDKGEIYWNEQLVNQPTWFFGPPRTAYTPQMPRLFSETLRNNILLGLAERDVQMSEALELAVMEQDVTELEGGLDTFVGPRGAKLSGGQTQRTGAARMFIRKPDLYVFDDMSSALDIDTTSMLWNRLFRQEGNTCLAVSHNPRALLHADHIIVLKNGFIEAEGKLNDLLQCCEEMQLIWKSVNRTQHNVVDPGS